jgi:hypothetical protein
MNVASDRVGLIAEHEPQRLANFIEIFVRIHAHERARRTILFA